MAVRKINNSWYVDFRAEYVRYRKRSPENTKAGAEAYEALLRQKLARGEPISREARVLQPNQNFKEFAWKWFEAYVIPNNKLGEQRNKQKALRGSLVPFFGSMQISTISAYNIERYKGLLRRKGNSPKTINNRLTILGKCLATAYEWLELKGTPPKIMWLKCPPPKTDYLSLDECGLLLSQSTGAMHEMVLTALRTGMRRGEIIGLQWSSIDWQNRSITVRHSKCDYTHELSSPKSNRARHIPMDADIYTALFNRKRDTGYVFTDPTQKSFSGKRLELRMSELCKSVGLRKIGWHTLRHTFASQLAMKGVPLNAVQMLLGHSTISTTMRYTHLAPSTLRTAIDMLNPKTLISPDFGQPVGNDWVNALRQETKNP
jgi:integrase